MTRPRIDPALQGLYDAALAAAAGSTHPWAPRLAQALQHCNLRLKEGGGGFTIPLPWLGLRTIWIGRELAARGVCYAGVHTLLHEAAHHCGAVLPEWKLWFGRWGGRFNRERVYGDEVNSADAIASAVLASSTAPTENLPKLS